MSGNQRRQSGILGIDLPFRNPQRSARSPIASMRHREHVNDNLRCAPGWPSSEYRSVRLPQLGRSESGRVQPADTRCITAMRDPTAAHSNRLNCGSRPRLC